MEFVIVVLVLFLSLSIIGNWLYSELYNGMKVYSDTQDVYINNLVAEIADYKKQLADTNIKIVENAEVIDIKNFKHYENI